MNIDVYGIPNCNYCRLAKGYLDRKGLAYNYEEMDQARREEVVATLAPHARTAPIILVDGVYIGGYTELQRHINENVIFTPEGPKEILHG